SPRFPSPPLWALKRSHDHQQRSHGRETSISLSASIQTAAFVNSLSVNISHAFKLQEEWDEKIELKVNALKDTVDLIGQQVEILSIKESLCCHADYKEICVTPIKWNSTMESNWPERVSKMKANTLLEGSVSTSP
uniref:Uncharacterized protein n=1 Tax=Melopsittacus undulatus TaxID=13146 RepID=A0A8V5GW77_MELUD